MLEIKLSHKLVWASKAPQENRALLIECNSDWLLIECNSDWLLIECNSDWLLIECNSDWLLTHKDFSYTQTKWRNCKMKNRGSVRTATL